MEQLLREIRNDLPRFLFTAVSLLTWRLLSTWFPESNEAIWSVAWEGAALAVALVVVWLAARALPRRPHLEISWHSGGTRLDGPTLPLLRNDPDLNRGMFLTIKLNYQRGSWLSLLSNAAIGRRSTALSLSFQPPDAVVVNLEVPGGRQTTIGPGKISVELRPPLEEGTLAWPELEFIPGPTATPMDVRVACALTSDPRSFGLTIPKVTCPIQTISVPIAPGSK